MSNDILALANREATAARKRVERVAALLAKLMQDIHGDEWKISISHGYDTEMVLIIPHPGRRRKRPTTRKSEAGR
ncbi:hypothetical protein [Shinella sp.]|uniref:hypothetical protein n=1 Tax=Shinella sp. TaxID=1870904 RepID=UPI00301BADAE